MRDKVLEYLKDKCCELSVINDDLKRCEETIRTYAKSIADGKSILWYKDTLSNYMGDYAVYLSRYETIKRDVQHAANVLGLKAEFEKMLQEYLDA